MLAQRTGLPMDQAFQLMRTFARSHNRRPPGMTNTMRPQLPTDTSSVVNNVVYVDGRPAEAQLMAAATQLGLHELAVEDAVTARQRPKLERYGDTLFVVLRSAHYRDYTEEIETRGVRSRTERVPANLRAVS